MDAFAKSTEFIRGNTFLKRGHLRKALDFPARKWDTRLARRHSSTCRAGRWRLLTANLNFPYGAPGFGREFPYVTRKNRLEPDGFSLFFAELFLWQHAACHAWGTVDCHASGASACRVSGASACRASGATVFHAWGTVDCHVSGAIVFHVLGITNCHTSGAAD